MSAVALGVAAARWRIVAGWWIRYCVSVRTLRPHAALLHKRPIWSNVCQSFVPHLVPATAARPAGSPKRPYAKWPTLVRAWSAVGASRPVPVLRAGVCRPGGVLAPGH